VHAAERAIDAVRRTRNPSVVGLDPRPEHIPDFIRIPVVNEYGNCALGIAQQFARYNRCVIDCIADLVGFVKPQAAFYEQLGVAGIDALYDTIAYAQQMRLLVILDAKRNDIGSTAEAYAEAHLADTPLRVGRPEPSADFLTVTPYLGSDGVLPFIARCKDYDKGIFVLVRTSNPSAGELQDLVCNGRRVFEILADHVSAWGTSTVGESGYSAVGAVVGATCPEEAALLRRIMPHTIFLMPGYGFQGGTGAAVRAVFDKDGMGALVSSSRGITAAHGDPSVSEGRWRDSIRNAVIKMRNDLTKFDC
jgi:orotidine-5'-phosphate decarboxylase